LVIPLWLHAQTAEDYFHGGAQSYIWGEKEKAKAEIYTGLKKYPQDPQLNGMAGLLSKKEEDQKQQQQNQQSGQSKKDQDQQQQNRQKQDSSQQNQQAQQQKQQEKDKQQQEAKQAQEQKDNQQQNQQQASQSAGQPKEKSDDKDQGEQGTAYAVGQMTPEQAQQLLDTQKNEEKVLPVKPEGKPVDHNRPIRDW